MTDTFTFTDLEGREVIAASTAEKIGQVKAVVLNRSATHAERLQVAGRKRSPELVDWADVTSVGPDAVMVRSPESVHESRDDDPDHLYVRGDIELVGVPVMTTAGRIVGTVTDVHINADGSVSAFMTDEGRVPAAQVKSLGTFGLVIA